MAVLSIAEIKLVEQRGIEPLAAIQPVQRVFFRCICQEQYLLCQAVLKAELSWCGWWSMRFDLATGR
jgi:hypothetical protein